MAALLAFDQRYLAAAGVPAGAIKAVVGISGPNDFLPLKQAKYKAIFPEATRPESQPIAFVDGDEAPILLLTGDADTTVDPGDSARLAARIGAKGGEVALDVFPGVGHVGMILALAQRCRSRSRRYLTPSFRLFRRVPNSRTLTFRLRIEAATGIPAGRGACS